jgi:sulfur carrier protein ThiS
MQITLNYVGYLKFAGIPSGSRIEVADGSTIASLLSEHGISTAQQRFLTVFVDEKPAELGDELSAGDELTVVIQVGGG